MEKDPKIFIVSNKKAVSASVQPLVSTLPHEQLTFKEFQQVEPAVLSNGIILLHSSYSEPYLNLCSRNGNSDILLANTIIFCSGIMDPASKARLYDQGVFFIADRVRKNKFLPEKFESRVLKKGEGILRSFLIRNYSQEIKSLKSVLENQNHFLQMAVHDLRSPLSAMICYSELLMDGALGNISGEGLEPIKIIHQNCQFLINMVNDFLDSAQMEAGKKSLKLVRANINTIIRKVIRSLDGLSRAKKLKVNTQLNKVPDIFIDPEKMERIIINLLGNAIKFTKTGGTINVQCVRENNHILFSIQDTGPGIHKKELKQIFEKFHVGDESTISGKGHGLGLVITKSFVEMHSGRIYVKSQRNRGSTFIVRLCVEKRLEPVKKGKEKKVIVLDLASDSNEIKNLKKIGDLKVRTFHDDDNWKKKTSNIRCAGLIINAKKNYGYLRPDVLNYITSRKMSRTPCIILVNDLNRIDEWKMFTQFNLIFIEKPFCFSSLILKFEKLISSDRRKNN